MEAEPAQKKLKISCEEAGVSGQGEAPWPEGKNIWNKPQSLLKRVVFLLDNLDIIPTDICFHVGEDAEHIHGHKYEFQHLSSEWMMLMSLLT